MMNEIYNVMESNGNGKMEELGRHMPSQRDLSTIMDEQYEYKRSGDEETDRSTVHYEREGGQSENNFYLDEGLIGPDGQFEQIDNSMSVEMNGSFPSGMNGVVGYDGAEYSVQTNEGNTGVTKMLDNVGRGPYDFAAAAGSHHASTGHTIHRTSHIDTSSSRVTGNDDSIYQRSSDGFSNGTFNSGGTFANDALMGNALATNQYKLQYDANPLVIRKRLNDRSMIYRQNINIRFLRPPQPPAPGPLIIREVRPPQPSPAPPLVIRQRPPRPSTPPPLILREKPPKPPHVPGPHIIKKQLPPLPPPPRQVVIERYPPLPPKPRDIIIERWLPYGPMPKRKVIYQRAAKVRIQKTPKNMVVYYDAPAPVVQRSIKKYGVVQMDPRDYSARYRHTLLDSHSLLEQAQRAGVDESLTNSGMVSAYRQDIDQAYNLNCGSADVNSLMMPTTTTRTTSDAGIDYDQSPTGVNGYESLSHQVAHMYGASGQPTINGLMPLLQDFSMASQVDGLNAAAEYESTGQLSATGMENINDANFGGNSAAAYYAAGTNNNNNNNNNSNNNTNHGEYLDSISEIHHSDSFNSSSMGVQKIRSTQGYNNHQMNYDFPGGTRLENMGSDMGDIGNEYNVDDVPDESLQHLQHR